MKPTCYTNTNTMKYNVINMCGTIIPLKSKLYYENKIINTNYNKPDSAYRL
jgi:hypothetical protein